VHLSSSDILGELAQARAKDVPITLETCPHYLCLSSEKIEGDAPASGRTIFKCCPPIREEENREKLWQGLLGGVIDFVVSDHSPCTPTLKQLETNDFEKGWGGISSLQFSLSLIWTEARRRGIPIPLLSEWMSSAPAEMAGLQRRKGVIAKGRDADLVAWDPDAQVQIRPETTLHRHKPTPYQDWKLHGRVHRTYLRGEKIYDQGTFSPAPTGKPLRRSP
jgi:allantoinase